MGLRSFAREVVEMGLGQLGYTRKARGPGANPTANALTTATSGPAPPNRVNVGRPRSRFTDPLRTAMGMGWKERDYGNAFEMTRELIMQAPIIGIIISTRANECLPFGRRSTGRFVPGFQVSLRNSKEKPTAASRKRADEIAQFVEHTGDPDNSGLRDRFPSYLYKVATDSLMFAQDATEIVPDRAGRPNQFYAVDASTIRIAQHAEPNYARNLEKDVRYVQVVDGRIVTQYTFGQLLFGVRNPSTDIRMAGYGISEIEKVQRACAAILETWDYNIRAFTQGTNIRGIMNLKEPLNEQQFEDFREDFYRWARGVENAHTTNVMNAAAGFDYTDLSRSNRDLEYGEWTNFLIRILCAAYNISSDMIGFSYGNIGAQNALSEQNNEYKITSARERGLRPLLDHLFAGVNRIVHQLDENFHIQPVGLDQMTSEQADLHDTSRVRSTSTIDEVRAENGQEPLPDGLGGIILDPTYNQARQMATMQAPGYGPAPFDQEQMGGEDPSEDTDGGSGDQGAEEDAPEAQDQAPDPADAAAKSRGAARSWRLDV